MTVRDIAGWLKADVVGPQDTPITAVSKIEDAGPGSLTFLSNPKYEKHLLSTKASAILVSPAIDVKKYEEEFRSFIVTDDPYTAFLLCVKNILPQTDPFTKGVHPTAIIAESAVLREGVTVGAYSVIGEDVLLGKGTRIGSNVSVGKDVTLGQDCQVFPGVVLYHGSRIGDKVTLHSGCVIGSDGFGNAKRPDGSFEKVPQMGIVRIGDDCEIGANTTIDRATLGETRLGNGVKIDNLVHIGHNVVIGAHTGIAAQTGISGSVTVGAYCLIAGQVGLSGHIEIADRTILLGQSGVSKSITEPGKTWFGYPAKEQMRAGRIEAVIRSLPELKAEVERLKATIDELQKNT